MSLSFGYYLSFQQVGCSYSVSGRGASMSGTVIISSGSEEDLQSAVTNVGPISVAVDARSSTFRVSTQERMRSIGC